MFCTHKKVNTTDAQLMHIGASVAELNARIKNLEVKLTQDILKVDQVDVETSDDDGLEDVPLLSNSNKSDLLPDWLYDSDLKDGDTETISAAEEQFWVDLIEKYLKPIDMTPKYKDAMQSQLKAYRDLSVFAFTMSNALFVLIVFLLQLNKQYLHVRWPLNVENEISFDQTTFEFTIRRKFINLEPISMLFVLFFGVVLVVQFIAMLFHRFATISQILATTKIDWYLG
jgi:chitin synthase